MRLAMAHDTAGDPMTGLKWSRKTTEKISRELRRAGIHVSPRTVGRLLRGMGYSLRVNHKKLAGKTSPYRDEKFRCIKRMRQSFTRRSLPVISVDTKKKELVGRFKNAGKVWARTPTLVKDHDFRSQGVGMAVPYGLYDPQANRGHVVVGISHDTSEFSAAAVAHWWRQEGRHRYPGSRKLLILADAGGSNGPRTRAWKHQLQAKLCDPFNLRVTVCHYPPGSSKWNPIEHRLFSEISKNWAGQPLESYETMLKYIRTTQTRTGLRARATLDTRDYEKGVRVSDSQMADVRLRRHSVLPAWNYSIAPNRRKM